MVEVPTKIQATKLVASAKVFVDVIIKLAEAEVEVDVEVEVEVD